MNDWRAGRLADFAIVGPKVKPLDEDAPFITMADVAEWGHWAAPSGPRGRRNGVRAHGGDVLVARITPCLENGKIAQVPKHLGDVGGSTEFIVLRAAPELLLDDFLLLWAQSQSTHEAAISLMVGTSGRKRVAAADFRSLPISFPSLAEQRHIVDVMSAVDAQVEALAREASELANLLAATRESMFDEFARSSEQVPLSYLMREYKRPVDVAPDGLYKQVGVRSFGRGVFTKEPVSGRELGSKRVFWVEPGDLVINIVFGWEGAVAVVPEELRDYCGSHRFPTFRRIDGGPIEYVREFLLSRRGLEVLGLASPGGAGRNRTLNRSRLGQFAIPSPSMELQHSVAEALIALAANARTVANELTALRTLRSTLLTALLSQEIEIPESYDQLLTAS
jgi:type I restriction enzyme, S subunit